MSANVAVVLPAYNESATIAQTLEAFHQHYPNAALYVIDNNSNDDTAAIARNTLAKLACQGQVITELRQGKGYAVRTAFNAIKEDIIVMADADLTYPADQITSLIQPILNDEADMVVGNRHANDCYKHENNRPLHLFGNRLVKSLVNKLFHAQLNDIMSGYRAFNRRFITHYPILVAGFELETDMTLFALDRRFRIQEIAINYQDRPANSFSKLNTIKDGIKVLGTVFNIFRYYRPLALFTSIAILFAAFGLAAGLPVINEFMLTGKITHLPLAVLAASLETIAVLSGFTGLILDALAYQTKSQFELFLKKN